MKVYIFRTFPFPIIRNLSLYTQQWCMPYRFADSFASGIRIMLARCQQTCTIRVYTIAVFTVKNCGPSSSDGIVTDLKAGRSGVESRWGLDFPKLSR